MTKTQLIDSIAKSTDLTKKNSEIAVNAFIESVCKALADGEKVQIAGFGTFEVKERAARVGRNPQTGATMKIKAAKRLSFSAGKAVKELINAKKKKKKK